MIQGNQRRSGLILLPEIRRGSENETERRVGEFQFLRRFGKFRLLLRFFSGGDRFAKLARMFAVESALHRFGNGNAVKILREHVRPRDSLEHGPMPANRRDERNNQ